MVLQWISIQVQLPQRKITSFTFWNLDNIPAREFARIPILETLHSTYGFVIFGICESMLTEDILNEDIFVDVCSPDILRSDKPTDFETLPETIVAEI